MGVFLALVLAACNGGTEVSQQVDPERLIPGQANFIAKVKVGEILRDLDLGSFYDDAPKSSDDPQSFEDLLDLALAKPGLTFGSSRPPSFSGMFPRRMSSSAQWPRVALSKLRY